MKKVLLVVIAGAFGVAALWLWLVIRLIDSATALLRWR